MKYLVDTSALIRIERGQVTAWDETVERGLLMLCGPVLAETLAVADSKRYRQLEDRLWDTYPWATVPADVWDLVAAIRRELTPHSVHQGMSVADLVVAATAIRLKLEVLHEDGDFETVARFVPELHQRRISSDPDEAR
jgi:predicted nucleic acid-binding protein